MNKSELVTKVASVSGYSKKDTEIITDAFLNAIVQTLADGEKITLTNFGSFEVKEHGLRVGRNPKSGEAVIIEPSKTTVFHPSPFLKNAVK